jgi:hypothetical protein
VNGRSIDKMNVMNFIKQKSQGDKLGAGERWGEEYQKALNKQNSKKLIQGNHFPAPLAHLASSQPQGQLNF